MSEKTNGAEQEKPSSRARAATADERIDHIARMMAKGEWRGMKSREKLADEWGVHQRTVGDWACRAHAVVSRRGAPIEEEIDQALADLEGIKRMALDNERVVIDRKGDAHYFASPMLREATDAVKLRMEIRGVLTKARGTEAPSDARAELLKKSPEERIAMHKAAIAEEEAKLKGERDGGMH